MHDHFLHICILVDLNIYLSKPVASSWVLDFFAIEHNGEYLYLTDTEKCFKGLAQRLKLAEGHIEAGRLLAYYQV